MVRMPVPLKLSQHSFSKTHSVTPNTDPREFIECPFYPFRRTFEFSGFTKKRYLFILGGRLRNLDLMIEF